MTSEQYITLLFAGATYIKDNIISPNSAGSTIETRYITSEGNNDEDWIGHLRGTDGKANIWLITFLGLQGLGKENNAVGTTDKRVRILLDFFYDYRQGVDYVEDESTNSEREFLTRLFGVDFALEQKKGCLTNGIEILDWNFSIKLKRFNNDTTHWAQGVLNLEYSAIIL